jgi:peptidoglycan-associated lipoprotein
MNRIWAGTLLAVTLGIGTGGCAAKVNQDVFDEEMARLRGEITDLDGRVDANRADIQAMNARLDVVEGELATLREDFDVAITRLEDGIRFATPVHFDFDRADVRAADQPLLDRFADIVGGHYDGALITVEGFADPAGSAAYNKRLSERRARSVASYLESRGLPASALRTVGYGEERPVTPGARGPGNAGLQNRRVAFVIEYAPARSGTPMTAQAEG